MTLTTDLLAEIPMLLGLRSLSIFQDDTELDDDTRLSEVTKTSSISLRAMVGDIDEEISLECQKISEVAKLLCQHTHEDVELVKHNHMIQEKHREAQSAVMEAWLQYAYTSSDEECTTENDDGLLPTPNFLGYRK